MSNPRDYQPSKNDRHHPAKYLHTHDCFVWDGAPCDCARIPNPAYSPTKGGES